MGAWSLKTNRGRSGNKALTLASGDGNIVYVLQRPPLVWYLVHDHLLAGALAYVSPHTHPRRLPPSCCPGCRAVPALTSELTVRSFVRDATTGAVTIVPAKSGMPLILHGGTVATDEDLQAVVARSDLDRAGSASRLLRGLHTNVQEKNTADESFETVLLNIYGGMKLDQARNNRII